MILTSLPRIHDCTTTDSFLSILLLKLWQTVSYFSLFIRVNDNSLIIHTHFSPHSLEQDQEVTYEEVAEEPAPHVIETGDSVKVKQVLDDATSETLITDGFVPNYFWENLKLFFMFLSCVFAMIAQFYPIPFPSSRPLLGFCCAMYFLLSTVLQGMITYIDKDIILIGKADKVRLI